MWRTLERELIDILKQYRVEVHYDAGDTYVVDDNTGYNLFSVTELAKELINRGIGAPR